MDEVEYWVEQLKSGDIKSRINAVKRLGELKDKRAVPALIELFGSGFLDLFVSNALIVIGKPALPILIEELNNKSHLIRDGVIRVLQDIGDASAVPALIERLKSEVDFEIGLSAGLALAGIGEPAVPALIEVFKDKNEKVRNKAGKVLVDIGAPAALALIKELKNPNIRLNIVKLLGEIGDASAVPVLIERLKDKDEDKNVREWVIQVLGEIGDASAVPVLIERLKDKDTSIRRGAALALGYIRDASVVPVLIERLKDKDMEMRLRTAQALGEIGDASAVPSLVKSLKDKFWEVRKYVVQALGEIGDASAVPHLIEVLGDRNKYVREYGALALKEIVGRCKTIENFEEVEKGIEKGSVALRKGRPDKTMLITLQIKIAKLTSEIAKKKDELAPTKDLLLDDKPKPPKKGRGVYRTLNRTLRL